MAGRPQHSHDGGIVERRLRPIYDWLDNGNNKKALQEAEKVLKKSPALQAARALKALSLLRLGKSAEAHTVLDALSEEKPSDDTTLQAMTICYRESQQLPKVCALYEAAVKAEPTSEELHSHLFMSYVRIGDHRSQQRAAMALYKFAPKNPYYFWAVMSIVLQAKATDDETKKGILLTLAQRMVDNFITENKMEAEQESRLYIMILELQEKWEDILKFLESPLYARLVPGSMPQASMPYLRKLGQWKRLNLLCKDLLMDHQDRWDYYMPYFDSVFELMAGKNSSEVVDGESNVDNTAEKCHEFICTLVESMGTSRAMRGPYLARLELWRRLAETGDPSALLGSGVALCVQYLRVFANKPCAVPDLKPYLDMLSQKEREEHCRDFLTCLGFDENSTPETADDIQRHVNCVGAWRLCAAPADTLQNLNIATSLRQNYLRCLRHHLVTSTPTEFCAADMYGLLAAHHYFYAARELRSSRPVMEMLCLLELVLHKSPANFHVKLLLINTYHLIGNAFAADTIYQRVEVKHVQLVSLGWLHCARLAPGCAHSRALQLLSDTRAFHTHHAKDSVEHLTYAYKYGTFDKLVELLALHSRLAACLWCRQASVERALGSLLAGPPQPLHAPHAHTQTPRDNRDLNVIVNWEPPQFRDKDLQARTVDQETSYLGLKEALVASIALCIELSDSRPVEEKRQQYEELKKSIEGFKSEMDRCKEKYSAPEKISISSPFPARIIAFVNAPVPYRELYSTTFTFVADLSINQSTCHEIGQSVVRLVEESCLHLRKGLSQKFKDEDCMWMMREALEDINNYLEFIGIITYILGVCNELVTPTQTKKSKKKAASKSPDEIKTAELLKKLNQTVQLCIINVEDVFIKWPHYNTNSTLETAFSALNLDEYYHCPIEHRLQNGRKDMVKDVLNILQIKLKYLKSLQ